MGKAAINDTESRQKGYLSTVCIEHATRFLSFILSSTEFGHSLQEGVFFVLRTACKKIRGKFLGEILALSREVRKFITLARRVSCQKFGRGWDHIWLQYSSSLGVSCHGSIVLLLHVGGTGLCTQIGLDPLRYRLVFARLETDRKQTPGNLNMGYMWTVEAHD